MFKVKCVSTGLYLGGRSCYMPVWGNGKLYRYKYNALKAIERHIQVGNRRKEIGGWRDCFKPKEDLLIEEFELIRKDSV